MQRPVGLFEAGRNLVVGTLVYLIAAQVFPPQRLSVPADRTAAAGQSAEYSTSTFTSCFSRFSWTVVGGCASEVPQPTLAQEARHKQRQRPTPKVRAARAAIRTRSASRRENVNGKEEGNAGESTSSSSQEKGRTACDVAQDNREGFFARRAEAGEASQNERRCESVSCPPQQQIPYAGVSHSPHKVSDGRNTERQAGNLPVSDVACEIADGRKNSSNKAQQSGSSTPADTVHETTNGQTSGATHADTATTPSPPVAQRSPPSSGDASPQKLVSDIPPRSTLVTQEPPPRHNSSSSSALVESLPQENESSATTPLHTTAAYEVPPITPDTGVSPPCSESVSTHTTPPQAIRSAAHAAIHANVGTLMKSLREIGRIYVAQVESHVLPSVGGPGAFKEKKDESSNCTDGTSSQRSTDGDGNVNISQDTELAVSPPLYDATSKTSVPVEHPQQPAVVPSPKEGRDSAHGQQYSVVPSLAATSVSDFPVDCSPLPLSASVPDQTATSNTTTAIASASAGCESPERNRDNCCRYAHESQNRLRPSTRLLGKQRECSSCSHREIQQLDAPVSISPSSPLTVEYSTKSETSGFFAVSSPKSSIVKPVQPVVDVSPDSQRRNLPINRLCFSRVYASSGDPRTGGEERSTVLHVVVDPNRQNYQILGNRQSRHDCNIHTEASAAVPPSPAPFVRVVNRSGELRVVGGATEEGKQKPFQQIYGRILVPFGTTSSPLNIFNAEKKAAAAASLPWESGQDCGPTSEATQRHEIIKSPHSSDIELRDSDLSASEARDAPKVEDEKCFSDGSNGPQAQSKTVVQERFENAVAPHPQAADYPGSSWSMCALRWESGQGCGPTSEATQRHEITKSSDYSDIELCVSDLSESDAGDTPQVEDVKWFPGGSKGPEAQSKTATPSVREQTSVGVVRVGSGFEEEHSGETRNNTEDIEALHFPPSNAVSPGMFPSCLGSLYLQGKAQPDPLQFITLGPMPHSGVTQAKLSDVMARGERKEVDRGFKCAKAALPLTNPVKDADAVSQAAGTSRHFIEATDTSESSSFLPRKRTGKTERRRRNRGGATTDQHETSSNATRPVAQTSQFIAGKRRQPPRFRLVRPQVAEQCEQRRSWPHIIGAVREACKKKRLDCSAEKTTRDGTSTESVRSPNEHVKSDKTLGHTESQTSPYCWKPTNQLPSALQKSRPHGVSSPTFKKTQGPGMTLHASAIDLHQQPSPGSDMLDVPPKVASSLFINDLARPDTTNPTQQMPLPVCLDRSAAADSSPRPGASVLVGWKTLPCLRPSAKVTGFQPFERIPTTSIFLPRFPSAAAQSASEERHIQVPPGMPSGFSSGANFRQQASASRPSTSAFQRAEPVVPVSESLAFRPICGGVPEGCPSGLPLNTGNERNQQVIRPVALRPTLPLFLNTEGSDRMQLCSILDGNWCRYNASVNPLNAQQNPIASESLNLRASSTRSPVPFCAAGNEALPAPSEASPPTAVQSVVRPPGRTAGEAIQDIANVHRGSSSAEPAPAIGTPAASSVGGASADPNHKSYSPNSVVLPSQTTAQQGGHLAYSPSQPVGAGKSRAKSLSTTTKKNIRAARRLDFDGFPKWLQPPSSMQVAGLYYRPLELAPVSDCGSMPLRHFASAQAREGAQSNLPERRHVFNEESQRFPIAAHLEEGLHLRLRERRQVTVNDGAVSQTSQLPRTSGVQLPVRRQLDRRWFAHERGQWATAASQDARSQQARTDAPENPINFIAVPAAEEAPLDLSVQREKREQEPPGGGSSGVE